MRITVVQNGDYRAAVRNFERGGEETYAAQRYSVNHVEGLARRAEDVCVITVDADRYRDTLASGVRTFGLPVYTEASVDELVRLVAEQEPTHLIVRSPIRPLIRFGLRRGIRVFPLFGTSFPRGSLRLALRHWRVARCLADERVEWVANHALNSCRDLMRIGVGAHKIVPWDWPPEASPDDFTPKRLASMPGTVRLFVAGVVSEPKGTGDCIHTLRLLREGGVRASLTVAGDGEVQRFQTLARELGLADSVEFLGRIPHRRVLELMHQHDAVVVPSRPSYPEGLPLTIYDAYCSRTPLLASNHPMFAGKVVDREAALVFRAGEPRTLAGAVRELCSDPALYERLSRGSAGAWQRLQLPVKWAEMLDRWLDNSRESREWLASHSLASGRYDN